MTKCALVTVSTDAGIVSRVRNMTCSPAALTRAAMPKGPKTCEAMRSFNLMEPVKRYSTQRDERVERTAAAAAALYAIPSWSHAKVTKSTGFPDDGIQDLDLALDGAPPAPVDDHFPGRFDVPLEPVR